MDLFDFSWWWLGRGSARRDYLKFKPISSRVPGAFNYTSWVCLVKKWSKMCFLSPSESPVTGSIPSVPSVLINLTHRVPVGGGVALENGIWSWKLATAIFKSTVSLSPWSSQAILEDRQSRKTRNRTSKNRECFVSRTLQFPEESLGQLMLTHKDEDGQNAKRWAKSKRRLFFHFLSFLQGPPPHFLVLAFLRDIAGWAPNHCSNGSFTVKQVLR